jgi:hypothetical protein
MKTCILVAGVLGSSDDANVDRLRAEHCDTSGLRNGFQMNEQSTLYVNQALERA